MQWNAARIPVLATELMAGPGAEQLCQCLVCSEGNNAMISGESLPSFRCCAVLSLQMGLGVTLEFWQRRYRNISIFTHPESELWDMKRKNFLFWDNRTMSLVPEHIANRLFCSSKELIINLSRNWSKNKFKTLYLSQRASDSESTMAFLVVGLIFWFLLGGFFSSFLQLPIRFQDESEMLISIHESTASLWDSQSDSETSFAELPQLEWLCHSQSASPSFETTPLSPVAWSTLLNQSTSTCEHQASWIMLTNWRESSRQE